MIRTTFRTPGFGRLFAGLTASMFGDSLMLIVLSMWVKTLTGSNGAAGLTFLWMTAPALVAPCSGTSWTGSTDARSWWSPTSRRPR